MGKLLLVTMLAAVSFFFPFSVRGASLNDIISGIEKRYEKIEDLETDFIQENFNKSLNQTLQFKGKLFLKKPHFMRMKVKFPQKQIHVFDGTTLWVYTPAEAQVAKSKISPDFESHPLLALILSGWKNLQRDFFAKLNDDDGGDKNNYPLELTLKNPRAGMDKIYLRVDKKTFRITQSILYDAYGNFLKNNILQKKYKTYY